VSYGISASLDKSEVAALQAALKRAGREASNEVRHGLKEAGQMIQQEIQSRTPVYSGSGYSGGRGARRASVTMRGASGASKTYKGTHSPGLLKRSTKVVTWSNLSVRVYNEAKAVSRKYPGGYRYGKRLEFDPKFAGRHAFFYPGFEAVKARAKAVFDKVLTAAHKAYVR
jgi:hypothetical protein